ncbi:hypothetical protein [uncultured Rhodospira sp.]|mgnify:CR=1 FL=1|uniref:hypothetical protein n=1 Tax=uncultured Rhodospira sp. TaxID=1936189 RepID=UPI002617342E|nr:hypothetical protein [uncultured Rhodospira sp.]
MTKTLPVGLADSDVSMRLEVASAYTLVFFIMIMPLLTAMQMLGRERPVRQPQSTSTRPYGRRHAPVSELDRHMAALGLGDAARDSWGGARCR